MTNHVYVYQKGTNSDGPTLILLHGTGGNEHDLLPVAEMIDSGANVLGIRGNVSENGMPRFFKRLAEGVFDMEDLKKRTEELNQFLDQAAKEHQFDRENLLALGYSNGANIAANLLYEYGSVLKGAMLFHAMVPQQVEKLPNLEETAVFVGAGKRDPLIPAPQTETLISNLKGANAQVESFWTEGGHQLTRDEVEAAKSWYQTHFKR